jgi:hypothetical protein
MMLSSKIGRRKNPVKRCFPTRTLHFYLTRRRDRRHTELPLSNQTPTHHPQGFIDNGTVAPSGQERQ